MRKILRRCVLNKHILFTLGLGFSFLIDAHAQVSGTFTIDPGLAAGGTNFQTFSAAAASLAGGVNGAVTFNVKTGTYNEQVILNNIAGTSATNTITFNCNGATLTFLSTDYSQRAGVKLNGADYVTFDNLNVKPLADAGGEYGYGFHLINDADFNTIKNCNITNFVDWNNYDDHEGIVISGSHGAWWEEGDSYCDNNLIQNNSVTGGSVGITLASIPAFGNTPVLMAGNRIIGNTISNTIFYGIQMHCTTGTVIDGNNISGGPDADGDLIGMYFDYFNYSFSVVNNTVHGFHLAGGMAYGMFIGSESAAGQTCLIANNLFYDFQTSGRMYGINATKSSAPTYATSYLNIYNNTISLDNQVVAGSEAYGIYLDISTDVSVMNNIISVTRNSTNVNYGIFFKYEPVNFTSQRNVIYVPNGAAATDAVGYKSGVNYITISAWQTSTGYDYYSTDVNPGYTNLAGFNFRPTTQSIDNLGANLGILTDIAGITRNTTNPDVGCFEFVSAACLPGITAGAVNVLPDSVLCSGPKISLGLTGNSAGGGQTYVWQSATSSTGPYTDISGSLGFPYLELIPTGIRYYRAALTCGANTVFSDPKRVVVNTTLNSGTFTINSAQPTGGVNFNSFTDAVNALKCGFNGSIVFNVASGSGPYKEQLLLPNLGTTPTKTVTFNCNGVTITHAPTHKDSCAVVKLNGADYVTIDSLNVEVQGNSPTGYGFGIQLINDADHNTIKRCKVNLNITSSSSSYSGIAITSTDDGVDSWVFNSNCDSNLIANNTITGGYYGILLASNSLTVNFSACIGNIIRNNIINDSYGFGIYISGLGNSVVDSNDISQPTRTVLPIEYYGIYVFQNNYGLTISRNRIHNLAENLRTSTTEFYGMKCDMVNLAAIATEPVVIANNLVYTFRGSGLQFGFNNVLSRNIKYYHNTVSLDDSAAATSFETIGFGSFGIIADMMEVKDNIFFIRRGGTGAKYCIYLYLPDSTLVANYNNYSMASTGNNVFMGYMDRNYATLGDWLATRKDSGSVAIHPMFEDMAAGDYTPTKIALENRGFNVGINNDFRNISRNTATPDIGAIEYTICSPLSNPTLSVEEASVNTITFTWTEVPNTTGYRVSLDGINWTIPSSGAKGTTHVVAGLNPTDTVVLMVKALGTRIDCPEYVSQRVLGKAQTDLVFIPNTFSPNGNGIDDHFKVYSTVMKNMHLMVFNQWGAKVFESSDPQGFWDGNFKGKPQPVGVYVYVVVGSLSNGAKVNQRGTFNLIR